MENEIKNLEVDKDGSAIATVKNVVISIPASEVGIISGAKKEEETTKK